MDLPMCPIGSDDTTMYTSKVITFQDNWTNILHSNSRQRIFTLSCYARSCPTPPFFPFSLFPAFPTLFLLYSCIFLFLFFSRTPRLLSYVFYIPVFCISLFQREARWVVFIKQIELFKRYTI